MVIFNTKFTRGITMLYLTYGLAFLYLATVSFFTTIFVAVFWLDWFEGISRHYYRKRDMVATILIATVFPLILIIKVAYAVGQWMLP